MRLMCNITGTTVAVRAEEIKPTFCNHKQLHRIIDHRLIPIAKPQHYYAYNILTSNNKTDSTVQTECRAAGGAPSVFRVFSWRGSFSRFCAATA